jgi:hypothetical protein
MTPDIIFLSYQEPNAESHFAHLQTLAPSAKHVSGIQGVYEAYRQTAEIAQSEFYYLIDADSYVLPTFDFKRGAESRSAGEVQVFQARNAVNDLVYGYGGIKLVSREAFRKLDPKSPDCMFGCSSRTRFIKLLASETRFNTGPFEAWKAAFRECSSLAFQTALRMSTAEIEERMYAWCTFGAERPFGIWAIFGAREGRQFAAQHSSDPDILCKINDFTWLREIFMTLQPGYLARIEARINL